jgi:hypothetical protein
MAISNEVVRGGVGIEGRSRREVTKSSRPLFRLCAGARAISMVAAARAGVDNFWLTGARDEGALTCVRATFWMQPKNSINGLLAPQGLVQPLTAYQTRPKRLALTMSVGAAPTNQATSQSHASSSTCSETVT